MTHTPKFGKKCYDCTHRFICWTASEAEKACASPMCDLCHNRMVQDGEIYQKSMMGQKIRFAKFRCKDKRWSNRHSVKYLMEHGNGNWEVCPRFMAT